MVELVPKDIEALSGLATERPSVSQALSAPVEISGRPSGAPESPAASFVMYPSTSPEGMSSYSFSCGTSYRQRVRSFSFIQRFFL